MHIDEPLWSVHSGGSNLAHLIKLGKALYNKDTAEAVRNEDFAKLEELVSSEMEKGNRFMNHVWTETIPFVSVFADVEHHAYKLLGGEKWFAETLAHNGIRTSFDYITVAEGLGYTIYGEIELPNGNIKPISYAVRIKDHDKLVRKIASYMVNYSYGKKITKMIRDLVGVRLTIGFTDKKQFNKEKNPRLVTRKNYPEKFDPSSKALDEVIELMSGGRFNKYFDKKTYKKDYVRWSVEEKEKIDLVWSYMNRIHNVVNAYELDILTNPRMLIRNFRTASYEKIHDELSSISKKLARKEGMGDGNYIRETDIEDLAVQRMLKRVLRLEYGKHHIWIMRQRDYTMKPRGTGYSSYHADVNVPENFDSRRHFKFINEFQMPIGIEKIINTHPELAGRLIYRQDSSVRYDRFENLVVSLKRHIPNYGPWTAMRIKETFEKWDKDLHSHLYYPVISLPVKLRS